MPEESDGFAYVRALSEKTGVPVPSGLKDLDKKEILHDTVIERTELAKAVIESLGI